MAGFWKKLFGDRGERAAAKYLRRRGFRILARQFSNGFGEIDLIALDGSTIVFVEVKTRQTAAAGLPAEAVTPQKQSRMTRTALSYLKARGLMEARARFDVVSVLWPAGSRRPQVDHFENAFSPAGLGQFFS